MRAPRTGFPGTQVALAGLAAAELAASLGKLQRKRKVTPDELLRIERAAHSAETCCEMLEGRLSYWEFATSSGAYEKMYEEAITGGQILSGIHLRETAGQLRQLADADELDAQALIVLHDLFSSIANEINARFTSSGERLGL